MTTRVVQIPTKDEFHWEELQRDGSAGCEG